jgi:hypothetical protein
MDDHQIAFKQQCREAFGYLLEEYGFRELSALHPKHPDQAQVRFSNGTMELLILGRTHEVGPCVCYVAPDGAEIPVQMLEPDAALAPEPEKEPRHLGMSSGHQLRAMAERIRARDGDILAGDLSRLKAAAARWQETRAKLSRQYRRSEWLVAMAFVIFLVAILNFTAFWVASVWIGGDTVNGKRENGRYYLSSKGHYTEVSCGVWIYSRIHEASIEVTGLLGILGILAIIYSMNRAEREKRNPQYRDQLALLAAWRAQRAKSRRLHPVVVIWFVGVGLIVVSLLSTMFHQTKRSLAQVPAGGRNPTGAVSNQVAPP